MSAAAFTASTEASLIRATAVTLLRREALGVCEREPVGHPGEVVRDPLLERPLARREALRIVRQPPEDRSHHSLGLPVLRLDLPPPGDTLRPASSAAHNR